MNLYEFTVRDIRGQNTTLETFRGKVLLIVNTATGCGFTPQYEGLQKLYDTYSDQGFSVLDFPCNQFGHQAPGTEAEIVEFCQLRYHVTFPQFTKIEVNGKNEHPLYTYLKQQKGGLFGGKIKWNFTKFLVDREGRVVARFGSTVPPEKIEEKIKELL